MFKNEEQSDQELSVAFFGKLYVDYPKDWSTHSVKCTKVHDAYDLFE